MTIHPNPDDRTDTHGYADVFREEILEAAAALLDDVHDIDFHRYGDGPLAWLDHEPVEAVPALVLDLAERLAASAATASTAIRTAVARRDWLGAGRPLRCLGCDEPIRPDEGGWLVCRGHAEHAWCHHDDPAAEDTDRVFTVTEAEYAAHLEDRVRSGGPLPGDTVRITWADGTTRQAAWQAGPAQPPAARADAYHGEPLDLTGATGVEILYLAEDTGALDPVPADGTPVDPGLLLDGLHCAACGRPHAPDRPAVWDDGYLVHRDCFAAPTPPHRTDPE